MINLTTDFNPGDDYGDGPYTHVKVTRVLREDETNKKLILEVAYGTKPASEFVQSSYETKSVTITGADFDTFEALATSNPETYGAAKNRCRDQCLIDLGLYPGTIE